MSRKRNSSGRGKLVGLICLVVVAALIISYGLVIFIKPPKPISPIILPSPINSSGKLSVAWPTAQESAVGVQGYGQLAENGDQSPTPTASIAKLVTALSVLQKYPLSLGQQGPTITITQADVNDYNMYVAEQGSVVKVEVGEQITEYQALQAMMLPSANNMADALAIWAFGSIDNYVSYANNYVKSLGMNSTTIADASGFSPQTVSTSVDLLKLGEATLDNPVMAQIVSQPNAILPVVGLVNNVDYFLGQYNLIGIKTGNTDQAGGTFLSAAKYDLTNHSSITVIGAVMKTQNLTQALTETIPMLESVKNQLQLKEVNANTAIVNYQLPWASTVSGVTAASIESPYLPGMPITYTVTANRLKAPLDQGQQVGRVTFGIGSDKSSANLILSANIPKPNFFWKLTHPKYII